MPRPPLVNLCAIFLFLSLLWPCRPVFAKDSDNHGPHAGFIQDKEGLAVEIVAATNKDLIVYVMDREWVPLSIKSDQLRVTHERSTAGKNISSALNCSAQKLEGFKCSLPNGLNLQAGDQLKIHAGLMKQPESTISFSYPFKSSISPRRKK